MKTVELVRWRCTLNTPSPCEVSLNTVALFDLGLVSFSRFRSRMLTSNIPLPPSATWTSRDRAVSLETDIETAPVVWTEASFSFSQQQRHPSGVVGRKVFSSVLTLFPLPSVIQFVLHGRLHVFHVLHAVFYSNMLCFFFKPKTLHHLHHRCFVSFITQ